MDKTAKAFYGTLAIVIILMLAFVPIFPGAAIYRGVGPATGTELHLPESGKEFILEGGSLYLLHQETRHALVLATYVRRAQWTEEKQKQLRERFPELQNDALWRNRLPTDGNQ